MFITKNIQEGAIKDVDAPKGIVTGYLSRFSNVDAHNDIMKRGCYAKSIAENGPKSAKPRIQYLWNHGNTPIGKFTDLREDDYGLYFEAQMIKTATAQDVLTYYESGIVTEHSVGFMPVKFAYENEDDAEKGSWEREKTYTEVKLYEGSAVLWGANEDTPMTSLKSDEGSVAKYLEIIEKGTGLLRKGSLTDEACINLEIQLTQLGAFIKSLQANEPLPHSVTEEPTVDLVKLFRES